MSEVFSDFKFWSFVVSCLTLIGVFVTALINKIANDKITNNHLFHIAEDVKVIKTVQEKQGTSIKNLEIDVATLKGKQETTEKFIKNSPKVSRTK